MCWIKHIIQGAPCWKWSWFLIYSTVVCICLIHQFTKLFLGFLALDRPSCLEAPEQQMAWHHPDGPVSACCFAFSKNPRRALGPEYIQEGQTKIKLEQFQSAIEPQLKMRWAQRAKPPRVSSEGQRAFKCDRKKTKPFCFLCSWCERLFILDPLWVTIWIIFLMLIFLFSCSLHILYL